MAIEYDQPDERAMEGEMEAPRPRAGTAAKSRKRRLSKLQWRLILAAAAVAILAAPVYMAADFVLRSSRFRLAGVSLEGGKYVTAGEVEEKFALDRGRSVLLVALESRRREIEQIPWVKSAVVRRILPNQLSVTVRERVPVAYVRRPGGLALVDGDGVLLDVPRNSSFHFPVVRGLEEDDAPDVRRQKMQLFTALMKDLERGGLLADNVISEVDLQDPQDARVIVSESTGAVLVHLGDQNLLDRYMIYIGHIQEWKQKFPAIESVDLRYEGQVVINADQRPEGTAANPVARRPETSSPAKPSPAAPRAATPVGAKPNVASAGTIQPAKPGAAARTQPPASAVEPVAKKSIITSTSR